VLAEPRSEAMVRHLPLKVPAREQPLCLRCHVGLGAQGREVGVGCESCHGPAGNWVDGHYRPDWRGKSLAAKMALGLADTKTLRGRAAVCVGCHVGAPDREVDHDLIAAGHPALRFEFAAYLANLPAHWDQKKDRGRWPDFEARAWVCGQLESGRAALDLLADRAGGPASRPWPELSEFSCFACHHDLQEPSRRQTEAAQGRQRKVIAWQTWNLALVEEGVAGLGPMSNEFIKDLSALRAEMESRRGLAPSIHGSEIRTRVGARASQAAELLKNLTLPTDLLPIGALAKRVLADRATDWDEAAQRTLAHAALQRAWEDLGRPEGERAAAFSRDWRDLAKALSFRPGYNSPR
jgi:hypothetical protein